MVGRGLGRAIYEVRRGGANGVRALCVPPGGTWEWPGRMDTRPPAHLHVRPEGKFLRLVHLPARRDALRMRAGRFAAGACSGYLRPLLMHRDRRGATQRRRVFRRDRRRTRARLQVGSSFKSGRQGGEGHPKEGGTPSSRGCQIGGGSPIIGGASCCGWLKLCTRRRIRPHAR